MMEAAPDAKRPKASLLVSAKNAGKGATAVAEEFELPATATVSDLSSRIAEMNGGVDTSSITVISKGKILRDGALSNAASEDGKTVIVYMIKKPMP